VRNILPASTPSRESVSDRLGIPMPTVGLLRSMSFAGHFVTRLSTSLPQCGVGSADLGGSAALGFARLFASDQRFAAGPRLRATEGGIPPAAVFWALRAFFLF